MARPQLDNDNPWPGLDSFEESARKFFFGRAEEVSALVDHVLDSSVTVLYGRSGLGKTSLLRAGVFPLLRDRRLLPVYVRLDYRPGAAALFAQLQDSICNAIRAEVPDALMPTDDETLWEYLHRNDFELWSAGNQLLTPVIVIDQFEEIFTLGERVPELVEAFRNELGDLAENRIPAELAARIDENDAVADRFDLRSRKYKLLISLREDYLPALEEWRGLIPSLGRSRVRLRRLRAARALDAVRKPAANLITDELARRVVSIIAGKDLSAVSDSTLDDDETPDAELQTAEVEPALLSLFCRELNAERKRRGLSEFDDHLVEEGKRHTLSNYYVSCVRELDPRVRRFIEDELITKKGFRTRYIREDAVPRQVTEDELERLIQSRLLRIDEDRHGAQWIELTHDVLTGVVRQHRDERVAQEDKAALEVRTAELEAEKQQQRAELDAAKKRTRRLAAMLALTVLVTVVAVVLGLMAWENQERAEENQALAEDSQRRADENLRVATGQKLIAEAQAILNREEPGDDVQAFHEILAAGQLPGIDDGPLVTAVSQRLSTVKIIAGHDGGVNGVSMSPDGLRLASAGDDGTVRLWNAETGQQIGPSFIGHRGGVTRVAFSPDGRRLASSGRDDGAVRLWDAETGQQIGSSLVGHEGTVLRVIFSPDGSRLASTGRDNTVRMWDTEKGWQIGEPIRNLDGPALGVVFSPDGRLLATAGADKTVRLWDVVTGRQVGPPFEGHTSAAAGVAFSPDGNQLASASFDKTVRLWEVKTGRQVSVFTGHVSVVNSVAFSPDGQRLASASFDNTVRLWNVATKQQIGAPLEGHIDAVAAVVFSPQGDRLASASWDGTVRLWDIRAAAPLEGHADDVFEVVFVGNGERLASASVDGTVRLWNPRTNTAVGEPLRGEWDDLSFSPDGRVVATASAEGAAVQLLNVETGDFIGEPLAHNDPIYQVVFSPDASRVATDSGDNTVRLWDGTTGRAIGDPLEGLTDAVTTTLYFSPSGDRLAVISDDHTVRLWNGQTGVPIGKPLTHSGEVMDVDISFDGRRVATANADGTVRLWNADTGESIGRPLKGSAYPVFLALFSPDGGILAVASDDNTVRLWDPYTATMIGEPLRHAGVVTAMGFSPDGHRLVTASADHKVRLWDPKTGESIGAPLTGHTDEVNSIAFSPDGTQLASASADDTVRVWPAEPSAEMLCDKLNHNMTRDQWRDWVSPELDYDEYMPLCPKLPMPADGVN